MSRARSARTHHRFNEPSIPGLAGASSSSSYNPSLRDTGVGGYSNPMGVGNGNFGSDGGSFGMNSSTLEHENEQNVGALGSQIKELRDISLLIGDEVAYQRNMLDEMHRDFDSADDMLTRTMKRLKIMAATQSGLWVWILILFWLLVCLYIYFFRY